MAITDNFNRTSGLGSGWNTVSGSWAISLNELVPSSYYTVCLINRTETFPNDQYSQIKIKFAPEGEVDPPLNMVSCRTDGSGGGYHAAFDRFGVTLLKGPTATYVADGSATGNTEDTYYTIKISATGSTIKVFIDGVEKISATDTTYTSGKPGVRSATGDSITLRPFDDFECTDASPSETFPAGHRSDFGRALIRM